MSETGTERAGDFWSKSVSQKLQNIEHIFGERLNESLGLKHVLFWGSILLNQLTVHRVELAGGGSVAVAVGVDDR